MMITSLEILIVLFHEAEVFLFCTGFFFHYNSYDCVETDDLKLAKVAELHEYHPLGCYKVKDFMSHLGITLIYLLFYDQVYYSDF